MWNNSMLPNIYWKMSGTALRQREPYEEKNKVSLSFA